MANTLVTLYTEIGDRLNLDATVAANKTRIIRWANIIQNDILSRYPFEWSLGRTVIQTTADKTAGTVAVTNGSTSITGTSTAFASTDKRSFIQINGTGNAWYEVTNVSSQVLTIAVPFLSANNAAANYTLRQFYYDLPSTCFRVHDARISSTTIKLNPSGIWTIDQSQPDINTTGTATNYFTFRTDPDLSASAAKQIQIGFYPTMITADNIEVRYVATPVDLSADTDIPLLPIPFTEVILDGMEWLGSKFLNDPEEDNLKSAYEFGIQRMIAMSNTQGDPIPVMPIFDPTTTKKLIPSSQ